MSPRGVSGAAVADSYSVTEEGRVAVLRSALARVRLEEDRTARAEVRASLMAIADPSSAMPVRLCFSFRFGFRFLFLLFRFAFSICFGILSRFMCVYNEWYCTILAVIAFQR